MVTQKRALITHMNDYSRLFNMQKMTWHSNLSHTNISNDKDRVEVVSNSGQKRCHTNGYRSYGYASKSSYFCN